jgi:hypothetical protein
VPLGRAIGRGLGEAIGKGLSEAADRWVPIDRLPDLDIAPGAPGYLGTLGMAGRQMHFREKEKGVTTVAVDTTALAPALLRTLDPILPMLVVRAGEPRDVWWSYQEEQWHGPYPVGTGGMNLVVPPGKVALRAGDGPRHETLIGWYETVWCTLDAAGSWTERRR